MQTVLITGGAGFIGSHMSLLLLTQPTTSYRVIAVDNMTRGDIRLVNRVKKFKHDESEYVFLEGDAGDIHFMYQTMMRYHVDIVIHFGAYAYASESVFEPLLYVNNIVVTLTNLLEAMKQANVCKFIFSSSSAVYGIIPEECSNTPVLETSCKNPSSPYGQCKYMCEQIIESYATSRYKTNQNFSYALLRYFNVIGADPQGRLGALPHAEYAKYGRILDVVLDTAMQPENDRKPMKIYGQDYSTVDGTPVRDFIHVTDLVDAHLKVMSALNCTKNQSLLYNIGIGQGFSMKQVVEISKQITGRDIPVEYADRREGDPPITLGDASKIKRELGWQPTFTSLEDMIQHTWEWKLQILRIN